MEAPVSRLPFWLHELIAEAKRRARKRRLLAVLLLVVVAGVTAAVVLDPSGGGSRSGGLSGLVGGTSASSRSVDFGAFVLTVPKGFDLIDPGQSGTSPTLNSFAVADDSRTAMAVYTAGMARPYPANGVGLYVENFGNSQLGTEPRLPFDLHKLHRMRGYSRDGTAWGAIFWGGGGAWDVTVFEGSRASAAERAAIERALRSIRRAN
jgi:hypothetical protein